jgi:hypothetical protein
MQPPKSQVISNDDTLLRLSYHGQINQSLTSRRIGRISNRRNLSLDLYVSGPVPLQISVPCNRNLALLCLDLISRGLRVRHPTF